MSKDCTIQDVFHRFYSSFESTHDISPAQRKAAYHIMNCKKYISKLKDMDAPAIIRLLYNRDICKCSSCGGKIIPLPTEQHFIKPKPHMLC